MSSTFEQGFYKAKFPSREPADIYLVRHTVEKSVPASISLDYIKSLLLPTGVPQADPGGMVVPYEGGYAILTLMQKDWTNEKTLAKSILDKMVELQNAYGSWYQMYYPYKYFGKYEDRKVDSGAALIGWAMADYDKRNASTTYLTSWRKAAAFLKSLEWVISDYASFVYNQVIEGVKEQLAFTADMAEIILALLRGLDAYGEDVTDTNGNPMKRYAELLIQGIDLYLWRQGDFYYQTEYPLGAQSNAKRDPSTGEITWITLKQLLTFTQALYTWAAKTWNDMVAAGLKLNGMVLNSGFESDFANWYQNYSVIDTTYKHWGAKSSKLSVVTAEGQKPGACCYSVPIRLTHRYQLKIWYNVPSFTSGTYRLRIIFHNPDHTQESIVTVLDVTAATTGWTEVSKIVSSESMADIVFPSWTDHVHFDSLWLAGSQGDAYTDDYLFYVLHEPNLKDALDRTIALNRGRWGGYLYNPTWDEKDSLDEYPHLTALLKIALEKVDSTRYSRWINQALRFMRWASLSNGAVADRVAPDGRAFASPMARGYLLVTSATCILAGA